MTEIETTAAVAAEEPAAKPARRPGRPRKKAVEEAAAAGEAAVAEGASRASATKGEAAASGADAASEKPARTRRTRKKAEAPAASEGETVGAASAEAPRAEAEQAPVKRRPGRPRKKAVEAAEGSAADAAPKQDDKAASPEPPAKRRSGAVSKLAAAEPAESADVKGAASTSDAAASADEARAVDASASAESGEGDHGSARNGKGAQRKNREGREGRSERNDRESRNDRGDRAQNGKNNKQNNDRNGRNRNDRNDRRQRRQHNREIAPSVTREELAELKVAELRAKAAELSLDVTGMKKAELVEAVFDATVKAEGFIEVTGVLDILSDGYGFLRTQGYLPGEGDAYVGTATIRRNGLRKGDMVTGQTRPARENEKYAAIQKVISVNGLPVEEALKRPKFSELTPIFPDERLWMEHGKSAVTARVIDLAAPIGKGQRGLIVSPPKAGKTTILKDIAAAITANNPDVHLMYLGIDERPEEATDMERSVRGEVISSTFDMPSENHIAVAELVIERAKRLVEGGADVVILLDSITRLARAYNLAQPASGRILSGGVDSTALYPPKRFLGAARNIEGGGSLTILASALIETGSKMDEVIFEEFKGTGNMELKLDRNLADRRIFPAIDPITSGTRKEELLLDPQEAPLIWAVRRILANTNNTERAMDMLIKSLKQTDTNQEFLIRTAKKAQSQHGKSDAVEL